MQRNGICLDSLHLAGRTCRSPVNGNASTAGKQPHREIVGKESYGVTGGQPQHFAFHRIEGLDRSCESHIHPAKEADNLPFEYAYSLPLNVATIQRGGEEGAGRGGQVRMELAYTVWRDQPRARRSGTSGSRCRCQRLFLWLELRPASLLGRLLNTSRWRDVRASTEFAQF